MLMAGCADATGIMSVTFHVRIMFAFRCMADVADAVERSACFGIIKTALLARKDDIGASQRNSVGAVSGGCHLVMNHIDIGVTVGIMAVPAKLATPPDTLFCIGAVMFITKMGSRRARLFRFYKTASLYSRIKTDRIFEKISFWWRVAARTLVTAVIVVALQTDTHHDVLILDVIFFGECPELIVIGFMDAGVCVVTGFTLSTT